MAASATASTISPATMVVPTNRNTFSTGINFRRSTPGDFMCLYNTPAVLFVESPLVANEPRIVSKVETYRTIVNNTDYKASINEYELPNEGVKDCAISLLSLFEAKSISSITILPLKEGGISFEFIKSETYYNIQIDNEGDAVLYKEEPNQAPKGWDLNFQHLLRNLKSEFNGV